MPVEEVEQELDEAESKEANKEGDDDEDQQHKHHSATPASVQEFAVGDGVGSCASVDGVESLTELPSTTERRKGPPSSSSSDDDCPAPPPWVGPTDSAPLAPLGRPRGRPAPGRGGLSHFAHGRLPPVRSLAVAADSDEESSDGEPSAISSRRTPASLADAVCPLVTGGGHLLSVKASELSDDEFADEEEPLGRYPSPTFTSLADIVSPLVNHKAAGDARAAMAERLRGREASEEDLGVQLDIDGPPSDWEEEQQQEPAAASSEPPPHHERRPDGGPVSPASSALPSPSGAESSAGPRSVAEAVSRTKVNALRNFRERMLANEEEAPPVKAAPIPGPLDSSPGATAAEMLCAESARQAAGIPPLHAGVGERGSRPPFVPPLASRPLDSLPGPAPFSARSGALETHRSEAESSHRGISEVEWRDVSDVESDAASSASSG